MKCNKCDNNILMESKKNRDTGMYENFWWCDDHGRVDPTDIGYTSRIKMDAAISQLLKASKKELSNEKT